MTQSAGTQNTFSQLLFIIFIKVGRGGGGVGEAPLPLPSAGPETVHSTTQLMVVFHLTVNVPGYSRGGGGWRLPYRYDGGTRQNL